MKELVKEFERPGSRFRGKPFWAWNGRLEEAELRRQIRVMKRMGLGGFFMHSRVGLATPYLSEEWFDLVKACVDEARRTGMEAWMYDEDRWPSGAAGGLVTRDPRHRQRRLHAVVYPRKRFRWRQDVLRAFSADVDGIKARNVEPLTRGKRPSRWASHVIVFKSVIAPESPWYNCQAYLDTLSESAVATYIESTHDAYAEQIGADFGRLVPGVFTDEPNYGWLIPPSDLPASALAIYEFPWTDSLPKKFRRAYGYDILDHLPELFFEVEGVAFSRARYHYRDCLTALFVDAFARLCGEWCEQHGVAFTGHVLLEETLSSQTWAIGNAMRFYEHMQAPGIDNLTEKNYEFDTAKQCASVARQMGRKWILSELYGCTGWDFPFEGHKADGDWQAALGVNIRCPHLSWYTMLGEAKRDYPASIFHQSPWWESYSKLEDYYARIHAVMTRGEPVRPLLVIHPIESMWLEFHADWRNSDRVKKLDKRFAELRDWLLQAHLDFDYGDEEMMGRLGKVVKSPGGPVLRLGKAVYRAVLVPPLETIRSSTLNLLMRFSRAGGEVVFAGSPPPLVDAVPSTEAAPLAARSRTVAFNRRSVTRALEPTSRVVSLADPEGREIRSLLYQLREDEDALYLFAVNLDRKRSHAKVDIRITSTGVAEEWDPQAGQCFVARQTREDDRMIITTDFPPTGSRLFVILKNGVSALPERPKYECIRRKSLPARPDSISLDEPNVLVLDRPAFRIGRGGWRKETEILRVDKAVRKSLGVPARGGFMMQPWARPKKKRPRSVPVKLRYRFEVKDLPTGSLELAMEQPSRFAISLNGHAVDPDRDCGWWVDRSIRRLPLNPAHIAPGTNQIEAAIDYTEEDGLEAMFLLGDFGVAVKGTDIAMTAQVRSLRLGDWTRQRLPFYSSAVAYRWSVSPAAAEDERVFLTIPRFKGALVRIMVNSRDAGSIAWQPHELDVTDFLRPGANDICVEVVSSRRNAFGPLHQARPENRWTGPMEFTTERSRWMEGYNLKPCGLLEAPTIERRRALKGPR